MKKHHYKKERARGSSDIPFPLERRHTRAGIEAFGGGPSKGRSSRSNSVDFDLVGVSEGHIESNGIEKRSLYPTVSTRVITETELTASTLYKHKKAQIDSTDEESITGSRAQLIEKSTEDLRNLESSNSYLAASDHQFHHFSAGRIPAKSGRPFSRCCWLLVGLCICIAVTSIILGLGGIIYMELYGSKRINKSVEETLVKSGPLGGEFFTEFFFPEYDEYDQQMNETHRLLGDYRVPEAEESKQTSQNYSTETDEEKNLSLVKVAVTDGTASESKLPEENRFLSSSDESTPTAEKYNNLIDDHGPVVLHSNGLKVDDLSEKN